MTPDEPEVNLPPRVAAELAPAAERVAQAQEDAAKRAEQYVRDFDGEAAEKRAASAQRAAEQARGRADLLEERGQQLE